MPPAVQHEPNRAGGGTAAAPAPRVLGRALDQRAELRQLLRGRGRLRQRLHQAVLLVQHGRGLPVRGRGHWLRRRVRRAVVRPSERVRAQDIARLAPVAADPNHARHVRGERVVVVRVRAGDARAQGPGAQAVLVHGHAVHRRQQEEYRLRHRWPALRGRRKHVARLQQPVLEQRRQQLRHARVHPVDAAVRVILRADHHPARPVPDRDPTLCTSSRARPAVVTNVTVQYSRPQTV